jgi:predicted nucleic acid-binding Zn ribbon protein
MQEQQQAGKARMIGYGIGIALIVIVVLAKWVLKV